MACCTRDEPPAPPAQQVPFPSDPWAYVGTSPAFVRVDLAALRDDARFAAIWDSAGDRSENPLADLLSTADTWIVAWPEPTFSERLNVAVGVPEGAIDRLVPLEDRITYSAGHGTVIGHPDREWVVAEPTPGVLLSGTAEAVRAAVASPCESCSGPASGFSASLTLTEGHRRLASFAASDPTYATLLTSIAGADARATLALGLDVVVEVHAAEGANPDDVRALSELALVLARREAEALGAPRELLADVTVTSNHDGTQISWEIDSEWLGRGATLLRVEAE
jgi:hypothetical protein